jgi:uncharacterized protein (DUF736 family)
MALRNIGALWRPKKDGATYKLQGNVEIEGKKLSVLIFPNDKRDNPRAPDYRITAIEDDKGDEAPPF